MQAASASMLTPRCILGRACWSRQLTVAISPLLLQ